MLGGTRVGLSAEKQAETLGSGGRRRTTSDVTDRAIARAPAGALSCANLGALNARVKSHKLTGDSRAIRAGNFGRPVAGCYEKSHRVPSRNFATRLSHSTRSAVRLAARPA